MKYTFKPDLIVLLLTGIQIIIIGFFMYLVIKEKIIAYKLINVSVVLVLGYFLIKMPISTTVDEHSICIKQICGKTTFLKKDFVINRISKQDLQGTVRIFGSGGMGGYLGIFRNKKFGKFRMLAVSNKDLWLLKNNANNKSYLINLPSNYQ